MKKVVSVLLLFLIVFSFSACGENAIKSEPTSSKNTEKDYDIAINYHSDYDGDKNNLAVAHIKLNKDMFEVDPDIYSHDLSVLSSVLSACANDGEVGTPNFGTGKFILSAYKGMGIKIDPDGYINSDVSLYSYYENKTYNVEIENDDRLRTGNNDDCFSVAHKKYKDTVILFVAIRGTKTTQEQLQDFVGTVLNSEWEEYNSYLGFTNFAEQVMGGIADHMLRHKADFKNKKVRYLITGHSLGGAVANLVAYKVNKDKKENEKVFGYTYGALNSITERIDTEESHCIFNCFNYYDTFGKYGDSNFKFITQGNKTMYNKIGSVGVNTKKYEFNKGNKMYANHDMTTYYDGAKNDLFDFSTNYDNVGLLKDDAEKQKS